MDSFLSGYPHSYGGTPVGQGYTGNVSVTGSGSAGAGGSQGVDVSQLQPGDTFQGEIVSVNGEDVQIRLTNGDYMAAKLERDVQVAIGQFMNLQVQSNKDNRVVLKSVYDGRMQMLRVGEAALRAAHMAVSDRNMTLVSTLLENGMSINKNTLMQFNRLTLQNPGASMADLIKLTKLQLPVNDNSLMQLQNYQNMEHRLLDGIREASDEILKLYDTLVGKTAAQESQNTPAGSMPDTAQGTVSGQTVLPGHAVLENGGKFMEQVLVLLSGEEGTAEGKPAVMEAPSTEAGQSGQVSQGTQTGQAGLTDGGQHLSADPAETSAGNPVENGAAAGKGVLQGQPAADLLERADTAVKGAPQEPSVAEQTVSQSSKQGINAAHDTQQPVPQDAGTLDTLLNQLKGEKPQTLPNKIISLIREGAREGKLGLKDVKQLLMDSDLGKQLTTEQKAVIFRSEPFKSMLRNGLQKQWTLTPQELTQEGKVEEFYQKLAKESSQLTRMMNEAAQSVGQSGNGAQARAMANISENVEFMNQMNQVFNYVQLPLKFSNSQAHGDLYVYTNKKNMARRDGMLTAFLHLDMDNLGALDVSISLQTERNQVATKFYLDDDAIALVEGHIDELAQRLSRKGYQCKNMILEKEEDKTVLERMEEQVAGGNAVLGYRTFDTRA